MMLEAGEFLLPVGAELGAHAALDEGPAHGRRLALQLHHLGGVFRRQGIGNGGHELGHLHDRPLEAAERRRQFGGVLAAVEREPEEMRPGEARRHPAHIGADAGIARRPGGETVGFAVVHYCHSAPRISAITLDLGPYCGITGRAPLTASASCRESSAQDFPR
jgi:hypothetical protein